MNQHGAILSSLFHPLTQPKLLDIQSTSSLLLGREWKERRIRIGHAVLRLTHCHSLGSQHYFFFFSPPLNKENGRWWKRIERMGLRLEIQGAVLLQFPFLLLCPLPKNRNEMYSGRGKQRRSGKRKLRTAPVSSIFSSLLSSQTRTDKNKSETYSSVHCLDKREKKRKLSRYP